MDVPLLTGSTAYPGLSELEKSLVKKRCYAVKHPIPACWMWEQITPQVWSCSRRRESGAMVQRKWTVRHGPGSGQDCMGTSWLSLAGTALGFHHGLQVRQFLLGFSWGLPEPGCLFTTCSASSSARVLCQWLLHSLWRGHIMISKVT